MEYKYFPAYKPEPLKRRSYKKHFILASILLVALVYFFFLSQFWNIKTVQIEGFQEVDKSQISSFVEPLVSQSRIFSFDTQKIQQDLAQQFVNYSNVKVKKNWFKFALLISANERKPAGVWCQLKDDQSQCYYLDDTGVIFSESLDISGSLILKINDKREASPKLGDVAVDPNLFKFFKEFNEYFERKRGDRFLEFIIDKNSDLIARANGWRVLFDTQMGAQEQIKNLTTVLDQEIGEKISELDYIDMRLGRRVYYKFK